MQNLKKMKFLYNFVLVWCMKISLHILHILITLHVNSTPSKFGATPINFLVQYPRHLPKYLMILGDRKTLNLFRDFLIISFSFWVMAVFVTDVCWGLQGAPQIYVRLMERPLNTKSVCQVWRDFETFCRRCGHLFANVKCNILLFNSITKYSIRS